MIHYHGVNIDTTATAVTFLKARHACVSFAKPDQMEIVAEMCQSFAIVKRGQHQCGAKYWHRREVGTRRIRATIKACARFSVSGSNRKSRECGNVAAHIQHADEP
jgi:ABC-type uncharacterized transport system ATPase subunit